MTQLEKNFLDFALQECGTPYIWGGKGNRMWDLAGLATHKFVDANNKPITVLDCSGLVTWALYLATGGRFDLRGSHSAKVIWDTFPEARAEDAVKLLLYKSHVAIELNSELGLVLDANRGDENCRSVLHAMERGAKVEVHRNLRHPDTLLGYRRIPIDRSELRSV